MNSLRALCTLHSPDVVCVVETWLSPDISDSELYLPNFQCFCLDHFCRGGGILVYVKSSLSASVVPVSTPIELLLLSLTFRHVPVSLATFYRPPSCPDDLNSLHTVLSSLAHSFTHNLILVGNFNVNYLSSSPLLNKLNVISDSFSLEQIVTQPTHFSPSGTSSLIDLVFVLSFSSHSCTVLPPVSNSDHNSILFSLPLSISSPTSSSSHRVWLYNQADILLIKTFLFSIPWTFPLLMLTILGLSLSTPFLQLCISLFLARLFLLLLTPLASLDLFFQVLSVEIFFISVLNLQLFRIIGLYIALAEIQLSLFFVLLNPSFFVPFPLLPPLVTSGPL